MHRSKTNCTEELRPLMTQKDLEAEIYTKFYLEGTIGANLKNVHFAMHTLQNAQI